MGGDVARTVVAAAVVGGAMAVRRGGWRGRWRGGWRRRAWAWRDDRSRLGDGIGGGRGGRHSIVAARRAGERERADTEQVDEPPHRHSLAKPRTSGVAHVTELHRSPGEAAACRDEHPCAADGRRHAHSRPGPAWCWRAMSTLRCRCAERSSRRTRPVARPAPAPLPGLFHRPGTASRCAATAVRRGPPCRRTHRSLERARIAVARSEDSLARDSLAHPATCDATATAARRPWSMHAGMPIPS